MKKHLLLLALSLNLVSCGNDVESFAGVWDGSYTTVNNDCPFSVASDINPLFPMTITIDPENVFTVVAVDGSTAVGGQGPGEDISFVAQADQFGNYGSIAPYSCTSTSSLVGYLAIGSDQADVTLTVNFNECSTPGSTDAPVTCAAVYYGKATRTG